MPVVAGMSQWCPIIRPIFASGVPKPFQDCRRAAEMVSLGHTRIDTGRPPQACAETVPSLYWDRSGIAHGRPRVSPMPVQGLLMATPSLFRYWVRFVRCRHTIHFGTPRGSPLIVQRCFLERLQNYAGAVPRLPESRLGIVSVCRPRARPEDCLSPSRAGIAPMWGPQSPQACPGVGSRLHRDRRRICPGPSHGRETISRSLRERPHVVP